MSQRKTAIITGGSSGFGSALANRLAPAYNIAIADLLDSQVADKINAKYPNRAKFFKCNVAKPSDVSSLFQNCLTSFGSIDIVVNNAGIAESETFEQDDADKWIKVVDVDLTGVILGSRFAISHFIRTKTRGCIINVASLAGLYPQPAQPVYAAAKAGVVHFTRSLSSYYSDYGIRSNVLCPSFAPTPLVTGSQNVQDFVAGFGREKLVSVDLVVEAFVRAITDESMHGKCMRITPEYGIDFYDWKRGLPHLIQVNLLRLGYRI